MKITCIQMEPAFAEPTLNNKKAEELISKAALQKPDVMVLPETWNTGFFPKDNLFELADKECLDTERVVGALAKKYSVNIVAGSVASVRNGKIRNTACIFDRTGACIAKYDKTHLFTPMGEDRYFEKGDSLCKFTLDSAKCAVIICYDIRFPELTRTLALSGLDVLFVVSEWPAARIRHLLALTKARAIENQMFVACCNAVGTAEGTVYAGASTVHGPLGDVLCKAGDSEEIISAECDMSTIGEIRNSINVFNDRRTDLYGVCRY